MRWGGPGIDGNAGSACMSSLARFPSIFPLNNSVDSVF
jgi:hypothetical protein